MHADGREDLGMRIAEDCGHRAASGEARGKDLIARHPVSRSKSGRDIRQKRRFATAAFLVRCAEPVPASHLVRPPRLVGIALAFAACELQPRCLILILSGGKHLLPADIPAGSVFLSKPASPSALENAISTLQAAQH